FSGGMKQRIAIAMALMMEPALLIADEPTTALDATLEVATIELLKELQRDIGCSVLFISHHLGVVAELCDRVVVMYAGDVVERADVGRIFNQASHPYTEKLFECDPARLHQRARKLPTIPGEIPDLKQRPTGCIFAPRCQLVEARCSQPPPTVALAPDHHAACWLAGPLAAGGPT
ncbi:MAG: ATP-binding cassette domain-containing protein, partial [Alphaproteobacteria bacterium]|nr:ATP-binding cassette domain-containing protein [Alphaproteobacteria bacterium]